ncbi:MAG: hypothetical protein N3G19_01035 [Candidatus Pacearchaeota archaeon]|nr:hypothetical protein [Candidatus Pacearchaeota archaeon]
MKERALSEITLRKYEKPYELNSRELFKKICLSLGLLQPGDSRDIIVDILQVLFENRNLKKDLTTEQIKEKVIENRKRANLEIKGIANSNLRRQLKRLRDLFIVEKINNNYRISEFGSLEEIFSKKIEKFYVASIIERIKEYLAALEKSSKEKSL